jgi:hypothetical protein
MMVGFLVYGLNTEIYSWNLACARCLDSVASFFLMVMKDFVLIFSNTAQFEAVYEGV